MNTPLRLLRHSTKVFNDSYSVEGVRGQLYFDSLSMPTIERLRGKNLPDGWYDCEMGWWTGKQGQRGRAIRVLGDYSEGRIYLHPANWPHQVTGCIAVGLTETLYGVGWSQAALGALYLAMGGWEEKKPFRLEVITI